jgi:hypothetical protein
MATSCYRRVKNKNGTNPYKADEDFYLTLPCGCDGDHQAIRRTPSDQGGSGHRGTAQKAY